MSQPGRPWLTQGAYSRLSSELAALLESEENPADPAFPHDTEEEVRQARIGRIREILNGAVVGEPPPDDGIAEPGMVLTVRYQGSDEPETFLLAVRDGSEDEGITVYSPESPLGRALLGARQGESRSFRAPNGKTVWVTLTRAEPYGKHEERLAS